MRRTSYLPSIKPDRHSTCPLPSIASARVLGLVGTLVLSMAMQAHAAPSSAGTAPAAGIDPAQFNELIKQVKELAAQNKALQEKVDRLEAAQGHTAPNTAVENGAPAQAEATAAANAPSKGQSDTVVSGYGEISLTHPTKNASASNVDLQRAVIELAHRFNDKTKMGAEFEWEHAITSSSDSGESEVEQLWVEREFDPTLRGRAGLFLMPVGLINENHEPTAYYGVFRPDVDTKIIPSTWREAGLSLSGDTNAGLNWQLALTTAPNLSKWDPTTTEGAERGPLQAVHGEAQFAAARTIGSVGALNWRGVPGLLLGGSVVYDDIGQSQPGFQANGSKLLMWDLHGRYQVAGWDLAGEYVHATISNTEVLNESFAASSTSSPTLVPSLFYGGYVQAAYSLWQHDDLKLVPFVRYEIYNTGAGYGSLPVALGNSKRPTERLSTVGANFYITDGVVLKADYRHYQHDQQPDTVTHYSLGNSVNLGMGFSF